jgi:hypothetical protein
MSGNRLRPVSSDLTSAEQASAITLMRDGRGLSCQFPGGVQSIGGWVSVSSPNLLISFRLRKRKEPTFRGRGLWRFCGEALNASSLRVQRRQWWLDCVSGRHRSLYRFSCISGGSVCLMQRCFLHVCYRKFTGSNSGLARGFRGMS